MGRGAHVKHPFGEYHLANDDDFQVFSDFTNRTEGWDEVYRDDKTGTLVFRKQVWPIFSCFSSFLLFFFSSFLLFFFSSFLLFFSIFFFNLILISFFLLKS